MNHDSKARALPWTRWGLRPQTPICLASVEGGGMTWRGDKAAGTAPSLNAGLNKMTVQGGTPWRGPGAEPLAFLS